MIRAVIGTIILVVMNNIGLVLAMNSTGTLKIIGYTDYAISIFVLYFILTKYFESDFFKNLEK